MTRFKGNDGPALENLYENRSSWPSTYQLTIQALTPPSQPGAYMCDVIVTHADYAWIG